MLAVIPKVIFLGLENKTSNKDGSPYSLAHFAEPSGKSLDVFCKQENVKNIENCEAYKPYQVSVDIYKNQKNALGMSLQAMKILEK